MFKERLKALRESKGLTQTQLSEKLNIGRTSVSNYELGLRTPDIDVLVEMANFFDVTTDYLTGKSDFKQSSIKSYFTDEEMNIIQNACNSESISVIEETITNQMDYLKRTMLELIGSNYYNAKIIEMFEKNLNYFFYINLKLKNETYDFVNNINSKEIEFSEHIMKKIYKRFSDLKVPQYEFGTELSCLVENLFLLRQELLRYTLELSVSNLLKQIQNSSENVNNSLLEKINEIYGLDVESLINQND